MLRIQELDDVTDSADGLSDLLESATPEAAEEGQDYAPDPEPHFGTSFEDRVFGDKTADKPDGRRVTVATRKDIRGKVTMLLAIAGVTWSARDPQCGGALLACAPDRETPDGVAVGIATAITDLICDSPDLVKFFTSSGRYMKWLTLAMSVQPVLQMVFGHHVSHTVADDVESEQDWSQYGAG